MAPNATAADLATPREMGPEHNTNQPGPSTGSATSGNPGTAAVQGVSQGDHHGDEEKAMEMQRIHAAIQEERRAQIEEAKRQEAEDKAEKAKKERLQKAAQKEQAQKARIQRALQATPEEVAKHEERMKDNEDDRRRERHQAAINSSINGYLEAMGRKPRR
ncbi:hypothetical protein BDP81DRAFT_474745 [Colletotrichum phormii]|uniref:Uncharacterized protein n=1 Tax=Colletotrichum phormii TaxID=359342 RepID=A0AAI9ZJT3_9PEZI|nr:uncharacterized protein BDP81DRAFT_474745 [Colletotrichum phormii]KAK1624594.1 hypothetical protein BDP81DRAFT_474745 [Colletotrichum phormii]